MKIVIDIPEEIRVTITRMGLLRIPDEMQKEVDRAIQSGTPLPKGHGRMIDEDEVIKAIENRVTFLKENDACFMRLRKDIDILGCIPKIRTEAPTIIEADKGEE